MRVPARKRKGEEEEEEAAEEKVVVYTGPPHAIEESRKRLRIEGLIGKDKGLLPDGLDEKRKSDLRFQDR